MKGEGLRQFTLKSWQCSSEILFGTHQRISALELLIPHLSLPFGEHILIGHQEPDH